MAHEVMQTMDFAKFLNTGELSDLTVTVDSRTFKLHKFPLCIKSDFFRTLARSTLAEKDHVTLSDFPGGPDTFELVVSYCYNVRIDISSCNVCQLRCAAEFLQMTSPGNLASATDNFLQDTLTAARIGWKLNVVIGLILDCRSLGAIAEQADIIGKCVSAIVDTWLITPKFTRHRSTNHLSIDMEILHQLCILPLNWFSDLLRMAKERFVSATVRAALIQLYISKALDIEEDASSKSMKKDKKQLRKGQDQMKILQDTKGKKGNSAEDSVNENGIKQEDENGGKEDEEKEEEDNEEGDEEKKEEKEKSADGSKANKKFLAASKDRTEHSEYDYKPHKSAPNSDGEENEETSCEEIHAKGAIFDEELATILDTLLYEKSEDTLLLNGLVSPKWVLVVFTKAMALDCKSREVLIQLASNYLNRFKTEELLQMSPEIFVLLLEEVCKENADLVMPPSQVCRAIDSFLKGLSNQGALTPDIFKQILEIVPEKYRANEDTLFHVLEKLLQSEKTDLSEEQRQSLLEAIDYGRLSEVALQAAFDSKLVPVDLIAKAALILSSRLRKDLDAANAIIRVQEEELNCLKGGSRKIHSSRTSGGLGMTGLGTDTSKTDSIRESHRYRPTSRSTSYGTGTGSVGTGSVFSTEPGCVSRTVPSLASDLELQLALSSLGERTDELRFGGRQNLMAPGYHDTRLSDIPYDEYDYTRTYYRPLPSVQSYSSHKSYFSKHLQH